MPRSVVGLVFAVSALLTVARPVAAQTATYHFHQEASSTAGLKQLKTSAPDTAKFAIVSANMKNQAPGPRTIATFNTQAGVPGLAGVIPSGASVTFTVWMKKSTNHGTVFPQASIGLNFPMSATLCQATGTTALTTTLTAYTLSCTLSSAVVTTTTDRVTVVGGFNMTAGPGTRNLRVALHVEGKLNGSADSRVVAPKPVPPPAITSLTPGSGRAGASITIAGSNFGATQGTSAVTFFNNVTAPVTSWAATSITATVPAGAATGNVTVTVGGAVSNGAAFTVIPPPSITTLMPASGRAGDSITIAGADFGTTQGASTVTFNGTAATPTAWSATSISTPVPAGAASGPVVVTVAGQASNGPVFTVQTGPTITTLSTASGHVGTEVTIAGVNFGATEGTSTVTFNGTAAYLVEQWSDTSVVVAVPVGATTGPVVVTVAAQASNGAAFTVDSGTGSGQIEFLSPADGAVVNPGEPLTINLSSPDNSTFLGLVVVGEDPLGESDELASLPAQVTLTIPAQIGLGRYALSAFGVTTAGAPVVSTIEVDVERPDLPLAIVPQLRQFDFGAEGETGRIELIGSFADGTTLPVEESSNVTYASSDPLVATVGADAVVAAAGEGTATITATYGDPANGIVARIPVRVRRPFLGVAPRPVVFADQVVGTTASQTLTVTNNDPEPLSVITVAVSGDFSVSDACVAASPLAPGGSCTVTVSFTPTAAGPRAGAVSIRTSFRSVPVSVALTGTGLNQ